MKISNLDLLKAKAMSIQTALGRAPASAKGGPRTRVMAEEFNRLVDQISTDYPSVASALPQPIKPSMKFPTQAKANYIDLEILAQQVVEILSLIEAAQ
jgi:hypothetical protein